jgi:uncharacterized membrane protein
VVRLKPTLPPVSDWGRSAAVAVRTDLGLVVALTLVAAAATLLPGSLVVVRAALALPLVLALPGYAVTRAMLRLDELRGTELLIVSVALSIMVTVFAALLLQAAGVRLEERQWMLVIAVVTIAAAAIGINRGQAHPVVLPHVNVRWRESVALAGAVVLLIAAAALGFTPLSAPKGTVGVSGVWILPGAGDNSADLGVINDETRARRYTVELTVAGQRARTFGPFELPPGGTWTRSAVVGPPSKPLTQVLLRYASNPKRVIQSGALRCWCVVVPAKKARP